nr:hypothetical protein [Streptomyces antimycoticus]
MVVAVDDGDQPSQPVVCGAQGRFPDLSLVQLSVAEQDERGVRAPLEAAAQRHAGPGGQSVAERAGAEVDPGDAGHVRVVAEGVPQAGVFVEFGRVEEVPVGQQRVQRGRRVALAEEETVAVGPVRFTAPQPHHPVVEGGQDLGAGESGRVVAGLGDRDQPHGLQAGEQGPLLDVLDQFAVRRLGRRLCSHSVSLPVGEPSR